MPIQINALGMGCIVALGIGLCALGVLYSSASVAFGLALIGPGALVIVVASLRGDNRTYLAAAAALEWIGAALLGWAAWPYEIVPSLFGVCGAVSSVALSLELRRQLHRPSPSAVAFFCLAVPVFVWGFIAALGPV
ncbi:MAG: hypothetical protein WCB85_07365 [Candidatus Dormiibacterota bacterium]